MVKDVCVKVDFRFSFHCVSVFEMFSFNQLNSFVQGYIHGDINNCNIIVQRSDESNSDYVISGIIDFGDACKSFYVSELVIIMADLMSSCLGQYEPLTVANLIIRGYLMEFTLQKDELKFLRILLCSRLLQLYILGGEAIRKNPENEYVCLELKETMDMCTYLWTLDDDVFIKVVFKDL